MNVAEIAAQAAVVAKAEEAVRTAIHQLDTVRRLNGQHGYSITVNGIKVDVAVMDRSYQGALIRGREMIHLGALKALDGMVDLAKARLAAEREKFAKLVQP